MGGSLSSRESSLTIVQAIEKYGNSSHVPQQHLCPVSPEITRAIFSYLETRERLRMPLVCPAWADITDQNWMWMDDEVRLRLSAKNTPTLSTLHQHGISMVKVEEILDPLTMLPHLLQALPDMKSLNLSHCTGLSDEVISEAFSPRIWTSLTVLNLSWCPVGDMAVDCVTSTLPNLEELYISGCWRVKNSSMALVASRLRKLKLIEVNSCRIGNDGLRQLSGLYIQEGPLDDESLPQLQHISVQSSTFVNHVGLLFVRTRMQHLTTLNIAMSISVQDRAVYEIAQMATLKHLDMHGCKNLTARSIWALSTGSLSLTYLDISYCPHIGDDAMEKVLNGPGLLALGTFKVASTSITDRGLTIVAVTMKSLTSLDASSCKAISKQGIEAASRHLENLRNFYLRFCKRVRNDALLPLSRMANLKVLNLKGCRQIGSRGMEFLASGRSGG
ncbi:hypothetical protein HPB48_007786 [Haemaphysalis longicornis]|uniref:F-box domain-containing protein n=1 Tax=Haemaphysalis longicornis TaxID=44386 RepID=A0A9J6GD14_HAELO|nr:hypothetical protein HPB48_007786 [Haemaphysalis longicornis]